jgi:hypothetical protein
MTVPLPHGYPDWGRYEASADKLLADLNVLDIDATTDYGIYFLGDVPFFRLQFFASVGSFRVILKYYDTSTLTTLVGRDSFDLNAGDTYNRATPVLGAYLVMSVDPFVANSQFFATLTAAHAPWVSNGNDPASIILFTGVDVSHPNGITFIEAGYIMPGWAQLHGRAIVAATEIDLYAVDYHGALYFLNRIENVNGMVSRAIFLPPMHLRLRIRNLSGAAQLFTYCLQAQPGGGL